MSKQYDSDNLGPIVRHGEPYGLQMVSYFAQALEWSPNAILPGDWPAYSGPFATSRDALEDADEWHPEFDEVEES